MRPYRTFLLVCALLLTGARASAEQLVRVDPYEVHYTVVSTMFLSPAVAAQYGIERDKQTALVNISVLRNGQPVAARISGHASDLLDRVVALRFREVREPPSVYYITTLSFSNEEHWRFKLHVQPAGQALNYDVNFVQQLFDE